MRFTAGVITLFPVSWGWFLSPALKWKGPQTLRVEAGPDGAALPPVLGTLPFRAASGEVSYQGRGFSERQISFGSL